MRAIKNLTNMTLTVVASIVLIFLGMVYFIITLWMIKLGAIWAGFTDLDGNMIILTAGIVTAAAMVGSSFKK